MTNEEFIKILDKKGYSYEIEGDKIIVTHDWDVYLESLTSIPPGVEFKNGGGVHLGSLVSGWFEDWSGNIEGIDSKRLLNVMISKGVFI
jgi:hypothetical protein